MRYSAREYQEEGKLALRKKIKQGNRKIILHLATGGGKGFMMSDLANSSLINGSKVFNIMRRKSLITQTRDNYKKYHDINSSIIMGQHKGFDPRLECQIASVDTMIRRINNPKFDFITDFNICQVDEMHDSTSRGYENVFNWFGEDKIFLGYSATPYHVGRKGHTFWDDVVKPIEMHELRDSGCLVPDRTMTPVAIDVSGIKKVGNDFKQDELAKRASGTEIIGDIVENYKKYGDDKPAILFACDINHSKLMAEAFNEVGITAIHCDQETPEEERREVIEKSRKGKIRIVCNVNIFSTGVDMPWLEVGIMARPTMSTILYCQQAGRLLRPYKICGNCGAEYGGDPKCLWCGSTKLKYKKEYALFLDHANNTKRHGLIYQPRDAALENKVGREVFIPSVKQCPACKMWMSSNVSKCIYDFCNYDFNANKGSRERDIVHVEGELELIDMGKIVLDKYRQLTQSARYAGWDQNTIYRKLFNEFGVEVFKHINVPDHIAKGVQVDELLSSASKISRTNTGGSAKDLW